MPLIPLSPIDHVFTGRGACPSEFVFAYGGELDAGRLEESLRRAVAVFPPVASRLVRISPVSLAFEPYEVPVADAAFDAGPPVAFDILTPGVRGAVALPASDGGLDLRVFLPAA